MGSLFKGYGGGVLGARPDPARSIKIENDFQVKLWILRNWKNVAVHLSERSGGASMRRRRETAAHECSGMGAADSH